MNDGISLEQLSEIARFQHPSSEAEVATIAESDPKVLQEAVVEARFDSDESEVELERAQNIYDSEVKANGENDPSPALQIAAKDLITAEESYKPHKAKIELADLIVETKKRLARPMRGAVVFLTALAMGGAPAGVLIASKPDKFVKHPSPEFTLSEKDYERTYTGMTVASTAVAGLLGGFIGSVAGGRLAGREARRRARRIVARDEKATD